MVGPERLSALRACDASDDPFLYDVFCTTWESEVAALPNQKLARHVLRIQHTAQERRFRVRYPGHQRFVVTHDGEPAGRLYLFVDGTTMQVVDLTLMPRFRSQGIGTRLLRELMAKASRDDRSVTTRVGRSNSRAADLCASLGFDLVAVDDLDNFFRWRPLPAAVPDLPSRSAQAECR